MALHGRDDYNSVWKEYVYYMVTIYNILRSKIRESKNGNYIPRGLLNSKTIEIAEDMVVY